MFHPCNFGVGTNIYFTSCHELIDELRLLVANIWGISLSSKDDMMHQAFMFMYRHDTLPTSSARELLRNVSTHRVGIMHKCSTGELLGGAVFMYRVDKRA